MMSDTKPKNQGSKKPAAAPPTPHKPKTSVFDRLSGKSTKEIALPPSPPKIIPSDDPDYQDDYYEDPDLPKLPRGDFPSVDELKEAVGELVKHIPEQPTPLGTGLLPVRPFDEVRVEVITEALYSDDAPSFVDTGVQHDDSLLPSEALSVAGDLEDLRVEVSAIGHDSKVLNDRLRSLEETVMSLNETVNALATIIQSDRQDAKRALSVETAIHEREERDKLKLDMSRDLAPEGSLADDRTISDLRASLLQSTEGGVDAPAVKYPPIKRKDI